MDWKLAIKRNREALLRLLAPLFVSLSVVPQGAAAMLPRWMHAEISRVLRPAEAAFRRLVVIEAQGMVVAVGPPGAAPSQPIPRGDGGGTSVPSFPLFDPRKRLDRSPRRAAFEPRISFLDGRDPGRPAPKPAPAPDDPVSARGLLRRLQALQRALDDPSRQARRLARWLARLRARHGQKSVLRGPLRPGRPPGHRARRRHEIDGILAECEVLARFALKPPDP